MAQVSPPPPHPDRDIVRRTDTSESWPPAIAFATFEGTVKEVVGRITHDDTLVELADLQRAEITQRRLAADLNAEAASTAADTRREAQDEQATARAATGRGRRAEP